MRVLYVNPMEGEVNPAIDAIAYGLQHSLDKAGIDVRMLVADFRDPHCAARTADGDPCRHRRRRRRHRLLRPRPDRTRRRRRRSPCRRHPGVHVRAPVLSR